LQRNVSNSKTKTLKAVVGTEVVIVVAGMAVAAAAASTVVSTTSIILVIKSHKNNINTDTKIQFCLCCTYTRLYNFNPIVKEEGLPLLNSSFDIHAF
jgi:hypothetical protein